VVLTAIITLFFQLRAMPLRFAEVFSVLVVILALVIFFQWIFKVIRKGKNEKSA
jgi:flagellar biogenesis protein FliO